jgi:transcriptional regulator with XRE-family HTH domain
MDAAALLRTARRRRGLTQAQLAARVGITQPVVSAYEHGARDPSTGTLRRLLAGTGERLELRLAPRTTEMNPQLTPAAHGAALVDVLLLADAIPVRRAPGPLTFPRIRSSSGG